MLQILAALLITVPLFASAPLYAEFVVPQLSGPVVDQANMLSPATEQQMDRFIRALRDSGGSQLQILTVPELGGLSIEEASIKVTDQWKLGSAQQDDGILLMVAAKERRVRIEVGQGREGDLTDVKSGRIIREVIVPRFREGNADAAITAGILAIVHYTDPKFLESQGHAAPVSRGGPRIKFQNIETLVWILFVLFFVLPSFFFRRRRRSGLWGLGAGGWYGGSSGWGGGGGFGGGGGGSWGGGGGGFSGGGASGGW